MSENWGLYQYWIYRVTHKWWDWKYIVKLIMIFNMMNPRIINCFENIMIWRRVKQLFTVAKNPEYKEADSIYCVQYLLCTVVFIVYSIYCVQYLLCTVFIVDSIYCVQYLLCTVFIVYSIYCVQYLLCTVFIEVSFFVVNPV